MFLAQIIHESGGLIYREEEACKDSKCPWAYRSPGDPSDNFTMVEATSNLHGLTITNLLLKIFLETTDYSKIQIRLLMMIISLGELLFGSGRLEFILIRML